MNYIILGNEDLDFIWRHLKDSKCSGTITEEEFWPDFDCEECVKLFEDFEGNN